MRLRRPRPASLVALCGAVGALVPATSRAQDAERPAVVYIVGTVHAPVQLRSPRMSPAYVRAALDALHPDAVCVESNPVWFARGDFYLTTYEAYGVAVPWANAHGVPAHGCDWLGRPDGGVAAWYEQRLSGSVEEGERLLALEEPDPLDFVYGLDRWLEPPAVDLDASYAFESVNSDAWLPRDPETGEPLDWGALDFEFATLSSFTQERDRHIAMFVDRVARQHPGGRIAVVFGAGHRGRMSWFLRQRGLEVEPIDEVFQRFPPGDVDRFEARLTSHDAAAILLAAWDSTSESFGIASRRAAALLERLRGSTDPDERVWSDYLEAREAMLRGDLDGAAKRFEPLAASPAVHAFAYRGNEWRLQLTVEQAARLELGRIADLQHRRDDAVSHYRELLATLEIPEQRSGYQGLAQFRMLARAQAAIRALVRLPYRTVADLASDPSLTAAQLVRVAARANNVGEWERALECVHRATESGDLEDGQRVDAAFARANALVRLGRVAEAEVAVRDFHELYDRVTTGHGVDRAMQTGLDSELESLKAQAR